VENGIKEIGGKKATRHDDKPVDVLRFLEEHVLQLMAQLIKNINKTRD
jgi:hypothetical protein